MTHITTVYDSTHPHFFDGGEMTDELRHWIRYNMRKRVALIEGYGFVSIMFGSAEDAVLFKLFHG